MIVVGGPVATAARGVILCDRCECVVFPLLQLLQRGGGCDPVLAVTSVGPRP